MAYNTAGNYYNPNIGYSWSQPAAQNYFAWVQGEGAAQAYQVPPNCTVILMDSERPILYMKSADATGRPSQMVKQYLVTEEQYRQLQNGSQNTEAVSREEFEAAIAEIKQKYVIRKEFRNE